MIRQFDAGTPWPCAVVEHDRQDRWPFTGLALAFSAQHRLQQQTRVDRHAQGHGRVDGVLKLDVYQQGTFAIRGFDLPDAIGVFLDQSVTDQSFL